MLTRLITLLLVAAFWWQGEEFLAHNGPTFDEPVHFAAGYSYWHTGQFKLNVEDPPLAKLLWTLPQFLFDPLPFPDDWRDANEWRVGHALFFDSGHDWHALLTPARRVNLLFGVGVVLILGTLARRVFDSSASGILASAFAAFDPNLLAHSCILSTDTSLTCCTLLTAWRAWEYLHGPRTNLQLAWLGIALGLTLGAKFSAVLVVLALAAGLLSVFWAGGTVAMPGVETVAKGFRSRLTLAIPVVLRVGLIALLTLLPLYFFVKFPSWGEGLKYQLSRTDSGDTAFFLLGEVSAVGWWHYFAVALAVKLPVGVLGLALLATLFTRTRGADARRFFLPVFALALFVLISISRVNLGVRVVLPVVPFVDLLAAGFVAKLGTARLTLAGLAVASMVLGVWRTTPYPLSYFNEFVGGPERGIRILGDSNLDWGQGLPALKHYLDEQGLDTVSLSYCGTAPPRAFGIRCVPLIGHGALEPAVVDVMKPQARRMIVVSASSLQGTYLKNREAFAWLGQRQPTVILAGCLWVYEAQPEDEVHLRRVLAE